MIGLGLGEGSALGGGLGSGLGDGSMIGLRLGEGSGLGDASGLGDGSGPLDGLGCGLGDGLRLTSSSSMSSPMLSTGNEEPEGVFSSPSSSLCSGQSVEQPIPNGYSLYSAPYGWATPGQPVDHVVSQPYCVTHAVHSAAVGSHSLMEHNSRGGWNGLGLGDGSALGDGSGLMDGLGCGLGDGLGLTPSSSMSTESPSMSAPALSTGDGEWEGVSFSPSSSLCSMTGLGLGDGSALGDGSGLMDGLGCGLGDGLGLTPSSSMSSPTLMHTLAKPPIAPPVAWSLNPSKPAYGGPVSPASILIKQPLGTTSAGKPPVVNSESLVATDEKAPEGLSHPARNNAKSSEYSSPPPPVMNALAASHSANVISLEFSGQMLLLGPLEL